MFVDVYGRRFLVTNPDVGIWCRGNRLPTNRVNESHGGSFLLKRSFHHGLRPNGDLRPGWYVDRWGKTFVVPVPCGWAYKVRLPKSDIIGNVELVGPVIVEECTLSNLADMNIYGEA